MLDGCFLLPPLYGIWKSFQRLSRGRDYSSMGPPMPLKYRDIRDEAERCICELPPLTIETLLTTLDDALLEWVNGRRDDRNSRDN